MITHADLTPPSPSVESRSQQPDLQQMSPSASGTPQSQSNSDMCSSLPSYVDKDPVITHADLTPPSPSVESRSQQPDLQQMSPSASGTPQSQSNSDMCSSLPSYVDKDPVITHADLTPPSPSVESRSQQPDLQQMSPSASGTPQSQSNSDMCSSLPSYVDKDPVITHADLTPPSPSLESRSQQPDLQQMSLSPHQQSTFQASTSITEEAEPSSTYVDKDPVITHADLTPPSPSVESRSQQPDLQQMSLSPHQQSTFQASTSITEEAEPSSTYVDEDPVITHADLTPPSPSVESRSQQPDLQQMSPSASGTPQSQSNSDMCSSLPSYVDKDPVITHADLTPPSPSVESRSQQPDLQQMSLSPHQQSTFQASTSITEEAEPSSTYVDKDPVITHADLTPPSPSVESRSQQPDLQQMSLSPHQQSTFQASTSITEEAEPSSTYVDKDPVITHADLTPPSPSVESRSQQPDLQQMSPSASGTPQSQSNSDMCSSLPSYVDKDPVITHADLTPPSPSVESRSQQPDLQQMSLSPHQQSTFQASTSITEEAEPSSTYVDKDPVITHADLTPPSPSVGSRSQQPDLQQMSPSASRTPQSQSNSDMCSSLPSYVDKDPVITHADLTPPSPSVGSKSQQPDLQQMSLSPQQQSTFQASTSITEEAKASSTSKDDNPFSIKSCKGCIDSATYTQKRTRGNKRRKMTHYHCNVNKCKKVYSLKARLKKHHKVHVKPVEVEADSQLSITCPHCTKKFKTVESLRKHTGSFHNEVSESPALQSEAVTPHCFLVNTAAQGTGKPLHVSVINAGGGVKYSCDSEKCNSRLLLAKKAGIVAFTCVHVRSILNNNDYPPAATPFERAMIGLCKDLSESQVERGNLFASTLSVPLLVPFVPKKKDGNFGDMVYFSLAEEGPSREIVSLNRSTERISCSCTAKTYMCEHAIIALAYYRAVFCSPSDSPTENPKEDSPFCSVSATSPKAMISPEDDDRRNIDALMQAPRIPWKIPHEIVNKDSSEVKELSPSLTDCYTCHGPLEKIKLKYHAKIFSYHRALRPVTVYIKHCKNCLINYRYTDYEDGLFNYNNRTVIELSVMEDTFNAVKLGTSILKHTESLGLKYKYTQPYQTVLDTFGLYSSMKELPLEDMVCAECGYYPKILIGDVIRSCNFKTQGVKIIRDPQPHLTCEKWLEAVRREDVARSLSQRCLKVERFQVHEAFLSLMSPRNRKVVQPQTLRNNSKTMRRPQYPQEEEVIPRGLLEYLALSDSNKFLQLLKTLGVDSKGTRDQKIQKVMDTGNYTLFAKSFPKIYGHSGGLLSFSCPHNIVYVRKVCVTPEGAADYVQALASMVHTPTVFIVDFSPTVAANGENNYPGMFRPYAGQWGCPSNVVLVDQLNAKARIDLPTIHEDFVPPCQYEDPSVHPTTGTNNKYCIFDRLHLANHKDVPTRVLRDPNVVLQLDDVNTMAGEQRNNVIAMAKKHISQKCPARFVKETNIKMIHDNNAKNTKILLQKGLDSSKDHLIRHPVYGWVIPYIENPLVFPPSYTSPGKTLLHKVTNPAAVSVETVKKKIQVESAIPSTVGLIAIPLPNVTGKMCWFNAATNFLSHGGALEHITDAPAQIMNFLNMVQGSNPTYSKPLHLAAAKYVCDDKGTRALHKDQCAISAVHRYFVPLLERNGVVLNYLLYDRSCVNGIRQVTFEDQPGADFVFIEFDRSHPIDRSNKVRGLIFPMAEDLVIDHYDYRLVSSLIHSGGKTFEGHYSVVKLNASDVNGYDIDHNSIPITDALKKSKAVGVLFLYKRTTVSLPVRSDTAEVTIDEEDEEEEEETLKELFTSDPMKSRTLTSTLKRAGPVIYVNGHDISVGLDCLNPYETVPRKKWLTCVVIDSVITLMLKDLKKADKVTYVTCERVKTLITHTKQVDVRSIPAVNNNPLFNTPITVFVYNVNNEHWVCVLLVNSTKQVIVLDPLKTSKTRYIPLVAMLQRAHMLDKGLPMNYTVHLPKDLNSLQTNSYDCGILAVLFVHTMLYNIDMFVICETLSCDEVGKRYRQLILKALLLGADVESSETSASIARRPRHVASSRSFHMMHAAQRILVTSTICTTWKTAPINSPFIRIPSTLKWLAGCLNYLQFEF